MLRQRRFSANQPRHESAWCTHQIGPFSTTNVAAGSVGGHLLWEE